MTRNDDGDRVQHNGRHEHQRHPNDDNDDNRIQARDDITQPDENIRHSDQQNNNERNTEDIEEHQTTSNTFTGFVIIMQKSYHRVQSWTYVVYKLAVLIYFFANLTYSIVATALQREHFPYHVAYMSVSLIGFVFELVIMIFTILRCLSGDDDDDINQGENPGASEQTQLHYRNVRKVLHDIFFG